MNIAPSPPPRATPPVNPPVAPRPEPVAIAPTQSPVAITVAEDDDDDDDLPRPGKVWTGPSLAELARQPMKSPAPPPAPVSNVESVDPNNLPAIWQALISLIAAKGPALVSLLHEGRFIGVQDGRAVIRYPHGHETMLKMLDRNGKKEQIRDAFTQVLGQSVGIAFECDVEGAPAAPPPAAVIPTPRAPAAAAPPPKQQAAPPDPQIRLTAELCASLRDSDPIIRAVMEELGGEIVRVE